MYRHVSHIIVSKHALGGNAYPVGGGGFRGLILAYLLNLTFTCSANETWLVLHSMWYVHMKFAVFY